MPGFTHIDKQGEVRMVDVTAKALTSRVAVAQGVVAMNPDTFESIMNQTAKKGNVLETARIAGIMAAKKTSELIPMCHPLNITHIKIDFFPEHTTTSIRIEALAGIVGQTGVEMEALTAVSVAALTIYDMCKSTDREMRISDIYLLEKSGGKSGKFLRGK
ncbi:MAG: cyclic pyranopterin monophosphate synthase MoaC [Deltaproteobacteria bacterium]|nr:cyclic pyranopterin monophosphate synthase MoaC [Deltaproteobacteria bacterium]MBW1940395.1 cyclic pyranopterin monophosphate synthase MoaC [Deltaproteobacteria bacterium]MBW2011380.1 cyclic pyranopterin monophosphate synthase MoaC [Deltaproteobacteria bacterium]